MAFITYPLNNIDYTAEDAELFHCTRTSGIWAEDSFSISVTGADNNVTIGTGIAWINNEEFSGKVAALKSAEVLDLGIADGTYPRIDVIAIQFNANNNATDVIIKKGTPATNPVRPSIVRTGAIYELYLASIYRPAGATAITATNITDLRMDETVCGLMADSVTKIDMTAIEAQVRAFINNLQNEIDEVKNLSGLMFETEWTEDGVIPVLKGGTGADNIVAVRQNLNFIGTNPITSPAEDTPANWAALGTGHAYIGGSGKLNSQPVAYGFLENMVVNETAFQTFLSYTTGSVGTKWTRSGKTGWNVWVKSLDENNGIQMKKLWQNASPTSNFAAQTINLDLSEYDYVLIEIKSYVNYSFTENQLVRVGAEDYITAKYDIQSQTSYITLTSRLATVTNTGIVFTQGCAKYMSASSPAGVNASYCIPVRIYGIKGVQ